MAPFPWISAKLITWHRTWRHWRVFGCVCALVVSTVGCQKWPGSQQASQFQIDRERLLGEFRAEKKRVEELAARNRMLEQRLAESEKAIARQNLVDGRAAGRNGSNSELRIGDDRNPTRSYDSSSSLSNVNTSRANANRSRIPDGRGLPDTRSGVGGQFTSTGTDLRDPGATKDMWRPRSR